MEAAFLPFLKPVADLEEHDQEVERTYLMGTIAELQQNRNRLIVSVLQKVGVEDQDLEEMTLLVQFLEQFLGRSILDLRKKKNPNLCIRITKLLIKVIC